MLQDYKLGFRMLVKYPGLTVAGTLALAIAIAIGAGWYDLSHELFSPTIPLPYSMKARHPRGWLILQKGRFGAGPVHNS